MKPLRRHGRTRTRRDQVWVLFFCFCFFSPVFFYLHKVVPTEELKSAEETNVVIAICVDRRFLFFLFRCSIFTISKERVQCRTEQSHMKYYK